MSLAREDMLRELELLPVWRLRAPIEAASVPDTLALAAVMLVVEPQPAQTADVLPAAVVATMVVAAPVIVEPVMVEPVMAAPVMAAPDMAEPDVALAPAEALMAPPLATTEVAPEDVVSQPLLDTPWLVLCPQAADAAAQQLLQNIVQALKLPPETVYVSEQALQASQVQSRFCILFGLQAANTFLGTSHDDMAAIRGRLLTHADISYVVTHHTQAMLENPLLKKQVWHDLCLLLSAQALSA
jgi:uracil-DNA glycosylase